MNERFEVLEKAFFRLSMGTTQSSQSDFREVTKTKITAGAVLQDCEFLRYCLLKFSN